METSDILKIEKKWQDIWKKEKTYESEPAKKKKYFITFPYPYMSGYLHLGHSYSLLRPDAIARYKRMQEYNVLYPFAFHCTGTPIVAAAQRVSEGEKTQIEILKSQGISEKDIDKFKNPEYWTEFFSKETKEHVSQLGVGIDWRRSFITTTLNPTYSKFIEWQFMKLKALNYVKKGTHPVVWCPKDNAPRGDHDRSQGEGVTPEEMVIVKFKIDGKILPAATFRPETTFGVTNIWLNPLENYAEIKAGKETWIVSEKAVSKISNQISGVSVISKYKGSELIEKYAENPATKAKVPVLPAGFVSPEIGTGVVMSVPSHAPYDYVALSDIKSNYSKYNLKGETVSKIEPISLISVEGYGEHPAAEIVKKLGIKDQGDTAKLDEATAEIYKKEFHTGVLKPITGKYKGMKVSEAKDRIISDFTKGKYVSVIYDLPEKVVCRCLTPCVVKIVSDQWFLEYSNAKWKDTVREMLKGMYIYPEQARHQFDHVIGWLKDWACTREFGLGTPLPWDRKWLIESLSDSTIYMAYYTIAHIIQNNKVDAEKLDEAFFDYIFLGKGNPEKISKSSGISKDKIAYMKNSFEYWYPVDMRCSGKDLIQNHLSFFMFNHCAVFPKKHWPKAISVNGHVTMDGEKMSKSKGNVITIRDAVKKFGADVVRITMLSGGERLDDANFDSALAKSIPGKFELLSSNIKDYYGKGRKDEKKIDLWFKNAISKKIEATTASMDETMFRTAIQDGFFDFLKQFRWYLYRTNDNPNSDIIKLYFEVQIKLIAPFAPHIAEELWHRVGKKTSIVSEKWPEFPHNPESDVIEKQESIIRQTISDVAQIKTITGISEPKEVNIYTAPSWKYEIYNIGLKNKSSPNSIIGEAMKNPKIKVLGAEAAKYAQLVTKNARQLEMVISEDEEVSVLKESEEFLKKEFGCKVKILPAFGSKSERAKRAEPNKPGIEIL